MVADADAPSATAGFGHYVLHEVIGTGGMGQVARATDTQLGRDVALKVMHLSTATDAEYRARFQREAAVVARLTDPHVIPIHGYGEIDGRLYLDMRLVDGRNLAQLFDRGRLEVSRTIDVLSQIADALDSAHQAGLVHRDVKPSNILVDPKGFAYLVDFGIAASAGQHDLTGGGQVVGSASYMAPERLRIGAEAGPRSDVYSLACVLYQGLTGSKPFVGDNQTQVVAAQLNSPAPSLRLHRRDLPDALDRVVRGGMAKDPVRRPGSASELMDAARAAMRQPRSSITPAPVPVRAPTPLPVPARSLRPTPGRAAAASPRPAPGGGAARSLWIVAALAVLLCVAVVAYAVLTS